jgi:1-acyl-sn-glycerol-3-phosphate acyltransferase
LRLLYRIPLLLAWLLTGLLLAVAVLLEGGRRLRPEPLITWWCRGLLRLFGIELQVEGAASAGAGLTVANHVSWLDIAVIGALQPTRFISKSEVRSWPVAGVLARAAGTFFIQRGKGGAAPVLEELRPHLSAGGNVTLFPEGTTTDGGSVLPFRARLFAAAIDSRRPVQPVALSYGRSPNGRCVAPFIGDDELLSHLLRLLREPGLTVYVTYCAPLQSAGIDRDVLAQAAEQCVSEIVRRAAAADAADYDAFPVLDLR